MFEGEYDVVVVGGGHAGAEAAAAAANLGSKTLLITMNLQTIGQMSCNPAMGGIAKGQIVREIDAIGGYSGIVSDKSAIQFKMLNRSKGPAMWSPRVQSDRMLFAKEWRNALEQTPNLDFYQDMIQDIIVQGGAIKGLVTSLGIPIYSKRILTAPVLGRPKDSIKFQRDSNCSSPRPTKGFQKIPKDSKRILTAQVLG